MGPTFSCNPSIARNACNWPEFAVVAADAGYGAVDLFLRDIEPYGVPRAAALMLERGLSAGCAKLPVECRLGQEEFLEGIKELDRQAKMLRSLGATVVGGSVPSSADMEYGDQFQLMVQRFGQCAEILEEHGLRLAIEFVSPLHLRQKMSYEFIWKLEQTLELVDRCGHGAGVLLDSWHWYHSNGTKSEIIAAGEKILHVHLADSAYLKPEFVVDMERLFPGDGVVRWSEFLGGLRDIAYTGAFSPEVFGAVVNTMPAQQSAAVSLERCKWIWENC